MLNRIKSWFKRKPSKKQHNVNISANIGLLIVDQLTRDRSFRRNLDLKYPQLSRDIDFQVRQIKP